MLSIASRRPIFVYGTLQPGHHNYHRYLAGHTTDERPATATGLALYDGPYPYAAPLTGSTITGTLINLDQKTRTEVLQTLDALEGYNPANPAGSHYLRAPWPVTATTPLTGTRTYQTHHLAYLYIAGPTADLTGRLRIPNGTWEPRTSKT